MNATMAFAVVLAVLSAASYAAGAVAQERMSARRGSDTGRQSGWWLALGANAAGGVLHVIALRYGTLTVVQPLGALTLVFALPLAALAVSRRVRRAEWLGAGLTVAGLGVLLSLVPSGASAEALARDEMYGLVLAVGAVTAVAAGLARLIGRPVLRGLLYGVASGVMFALGSVLTQTLTVRVAGEGVSAVLGPTTGLVAVAAVGGLLLSQVAYRAAGLAVPLTAITLANPVAAAVVGMVLLGEGYAGGTAGAVVALAAAAVTVRGVMLLTTHAPAQPIAGPVAVAAGTIFVPTGERRPTPRPGRRPMTATGPAGRPTSAGRHRRDVRRAQLAGVRSGGGGTLTGSRP